MTIPRIVIVAYRPKPGKADILLAEVRDHVHLLRSEGLATDRLATVMRAKDGAIIEVFEWASPAAIALKISGTASIDTVSTSLPGRIPASFIAWIAPIIMSSLCA